ncbi:MAG: sulfatase [Phycisphaerae bacterium]
MARNVLFILSDQHNADLLGCAGHAQVRTPNLDRLAGQSVRCTRAVPQSPICTPSRISYLSGQYCHNHGYYGLGGPRPAGLGTFLGHFRRAGWRTGAFGKIHCPEYWIEDDCDEFAEVTPACSIGGAPEYTAYLQQLGLLDERDDERLPEAAGRFQPLDARPSRLDYQHTPEAWTVRRTIEFIERSVQAGRDFCAHASMVRPHQLYTPSQPFWSMYHDVDLQLPPNADYDLAEAGKAPHLIAKATEQRKGDWAIFEPKTFEAARMRKLQGYLGCVSQVDHAVGELLDYLDSAGLADDTIVFYGSDHGEYVCQHGIMEKAPGICADAVCRVPFFFRAPGLGRGKTVDHLVEAVDVSATLCSLAGLEPMETSDGCDLGALLSGESDEPVHDVAVTEGPWSKSVRTERWRLVYYPHRFFAEQYPEGFGELYDLENDPLEMRNLFFQPEMAEIRCDMMRRLTDWLVTTTRPVTVLPHAKFHGPGCVTRFGDTVAADGKISAQRVEAARLKTSYYI